MITTMIAVAACSMFMHDYGYGLIIPKVTEITENVDEDEYIEFVETLVPGEEDPEYLENIEESEIIFIEEDHEDEDITVIENFEE